MTGAARARVVALLGASLAACSSSSPDDGAGHPPASPTRPAARATATPPTPGAPAKQPERVAAEKRGPFPPFARRRTPPPGIEATALAVGAAAPALELPAADGTRFALAEARRAGPVVVVFYRGFW